MLGCHNITGKPQEKTFGISGSRRMVQGSVGGGGGPSTGERNIKHIRVLGTGNMIVSKIVK